MSYILRLLFFAAISLLAAPTLAQEAVNPGTPDAIRQLRESATKDRTQADDDQQRVAFLRELAQKSRQLAELTSVPPDKASFLEDATRREADAKELEAGITRLRARADEKDARAARLETAYNEKYGEQPAPPAPPRPDPTATDSTSLEAVWAVEDLLGLWARSGEPGFTLAIVPQLPDEPAMVNRVEAHSDRRIWAGTFQSASREGPARAVLTYTPKPEEMNPAIPDQARRAVSGTLVWRLELEPQGVVFNPTLNAKWYPGEVKWDQSDPTAASVVGEGQPLEFAFEPVDTINIESLSHPTVAIKLPNPAHDPNTDPVEALIKGQRFFVHVTLPVEMAREKGPKITATVRALNGGGEEEIELTGAMGQGQKPVVYSHVDQVTVADCNALFEARRNPQPLSLSWMWNKVGETYYGVTDAGDCLNIKLKNEELVEIRYGDAAVQVPVYDSWVQRGIARHVEGAARLREVYQSILVGPYEQATKEAAHKKLRMLANYEALRGSDKFTDLHRFFVGDAYLGDASPALVQTDDAALHARYYEDRMNPPYMHMRTDSTYFTPLMQATLEGLSGKDLTPKAWTAGNPIRWTAEAEQFYVLRAIRETSTQLAERALKEAHENWSFGLYDGVATATQAGGVYLLISNKDHFNRPQPRWVRIMAAVNLASNAVLHVYGPQATARFVERIERRLPPVAGNVVQTAITALGQRGVSRVNGRTELPGVPKSVPSAKRETLGLEFSHDKPSLGSDMGCAPRSLSPSAPRSLSPTQGPLEDVMRDAVERVEILAYKNKHWGPETRILDLDKPPITARQQWKNCQERAVSDGIFEATGKRIDEAEGAAMMEAIAQSQKDRGLRTAASAKTEVRTEGFDNQTTRGYLRARSAKVSDLQPRNNSQLNLRHIKVLLQNGWKVKAIVRFGPHQGKWVNHAVSVREIVTDPKTGDIVSVRVYDSNVGRVLDVPAKRFQAVLREAAPNLEGQRQGIVTIFRFDQDDAMFPHISSRPATSRSSPGTSVPTPPPSTSAGATPTPPITGGLDGSNAPRSVGAADADDPAVVRGGSGGSAPYTSTRGAGPGGAQVSLGELTQGLSQQDAALVQAASQKGMFAVPGSQDLLNGLRSSNASHVEGARFVLRDSAVEIGQGKQFVKFEDTMAGFESGQGPNPIAKQGVDAIRGGEQGPVGQGGTAVQYKSYGDLHKLVEAVRKQGTKDFSRYFNNQIRRTGRLVDGEGNALNGNFEYRIDAQKLRVHGYSEAHIDQAIQKMQKDFDVNQNTWIQDATGKSWFRFTVVKGH